MPRGIVSDRADFTPRHSPMPARHRRGNLVRLEANCRDHARTNIGAAPSLAATPELLSDRELASLHDWRLTSRTVRALVSAGAWLSPVGFAVIKSLEHVASRVQEIIVGRKRVGQFGCATKQLRQDFAPIGLGQRLKGLQQVPRCVSHSREFYAHPLRGITRSSPARVRAPRR